MRCEPPNEEGGKKKRDERCEAHEDRATHNVDDVVYASTHPGRIDDDCKEREGKSPSSIDKSHYRDERRGQEGVIRGEPVISSVRNEGLEVPSDKRARIVVEEASGLNEEEAKHPDHGGCYRPPKRKESWPTIEQVCNYYRSRENVEIDQVVGQEDGEGDWYHLARVI